VAEFGPSDIAVARDAIRARIHTTPLLSSEELSEQVGATVLLKAELFQKTGSFKTRGAFSKLLTLSGEERSRGVIAVSSGNHAQAVAYCAQRLRIPCLAVMWPSVSPQKLAATRVYGATIDLESADAVQAVERAERIAAERRLTLVPAYDDLDVIAGQGTIGDEILEQTESSGAVLVPVSGGGLLAGVAVSIKARRPNTRIIAVEPESSPTLTKALAAGRPVFVPQHSMVDGLGAPQIGSLCYDIAMPHIDSVVTVSDDETVYAMRWLFEHAKLVVEPAGAVTTAALLTHQVALHDNDTAVALVTGGNIDPAQAVERLRAGSSLFERQTHAERGERRGEEPAHHAERTRALDDRAARGTGEEGVDREDTERHRREHRA
jgi:threonine dehydratase